MLMCGSSVHAAGRANDQEVRKELRSVYAMYIRANVAKNAGPSLQFLNDSVTPDFVTTGAMGSRTRQRLMHELKSRQPWEPARAIWLHINQLKVHGNTAIALVTGGATRDSRNPKFTGDPSGKLHRFVTRTTHRDTWVKTPTGWKVKREQELSVKLTCDGKPFAAPRPT